MATPIVVVGGGWAGQAAAAELAHLGHPVTLIEAARTLGGRARDVVTPLGTLDNGQHLLIGAYGSVLALLERFGVDESALFRRRRLRLRMSDLAGGETLLDVPALPAPLHLAKALTTARGLTLKERLAAVGFVDWLRRHRFDITDRPLGRLLGERRQPARLVRALWEPLCLATLNTPLAIASSRLFATVLQRTFTGSNRHCDLLLPKATLGSLLSSHTERLVQRAGGRVLTATRATALATERGVLHGIRLADGSTLPARHAVLATPPPATARLLRDEPRLTTVADRLDRFDYQPIATVYLRYPHPVRLDGALRGVLGGTVQWLVDRADCDQPDTVAAVISAAGPHDALDRQQLASLAGSEAARLFPDWPPPTAAWAIREQRATFASVAGVDALRPAATTELDGCWLAGDWTATGLPATLEGAVASGLESAHLVAAAILHRNESP